MNGSVKSKTPESNALPAYVLVFKRLSPECGRGAFSCGNKTIDDWFRDQAQIHVEALRYNVVVAHLTADLPDGGRPDPAGFFALTPGLLPKHLINKTPPPRSRGDEQKFPSVELSYVAVQTEIQKGGIGTKLMAVVLEEFFETAIRTGIQFLTLTAATKEVVPFYEKMGFWIYEDGAMPKMVLPSKSVLQTVREMRASGNTIVIA